jgi:hypothetical protein
MKAEFKSVPAIKKCFTISKLLYKPIAMLRSKGYLEIGWPRRLNLADNSEHLILCAKRFMQT